MESKENGDTNLVSNDENERNSEDKMANYHDIRKYAHLIWTDEQKKLMDVAFSSLDNLLLTCEREQNIDKYNALKEAHEKLHEVILSSSIMDLLGIKRTDNVQ